MILFVRMHDANVNLSVYVHVLYVHTCRNAQVTVCLFIPARVRVAWRGVVWCGWCVMSCHVMSCHVMSCHVM